MGDGCRGRDRVSYHVGTVSAPEALLHGGEPIRTHRGRACGGGGKGWGRMAVFRAISIALFVKVHVSYVCSAGWTSLKVALRRWVAPMYCSKSAVALGELSRYAKDVALRPRRHLSMKRSLTHVGHSNR